MILVKKLKFYEAPLKFPCHSPTLSATYDRFTKTTLESNRTPLQLKSSIICPLALLHFQIILAYLHANKLDNLGIHEVR